MLLAAISGVGLAPAVSAPPPVDDDFASVALLYPFDESDGSTATDDKSNSDHTALFLAGAEIDDAQKKFGNASLKLNGNDSSGRLQIVDSADWHFADAGFTVEAWVRFSVAAVKRGVIVSHYNANSTGRSWIFGISASQQLFLTYSENSGSTTTLTSAAQTINSDAWAHYAVTRDGNEYLRLFFGGTEVLNSSLAGSPADIAFFNSNTNLNIGNVQSKGDPLGPGGDSWIDDLRVTKGLARYTANFTPPTTAHPTQ